MRLSVVGLGKLGAPLAAVLASAGHEVIGVDVNAEVIRALRNGRAPVEETQLQQVIDANRERLTVTTDYRKAVLGSDLTFVVVPTPSLVDGAFSNQHVIAAVQEIGRGLREKDSYHVVNITSTVMPSSTGGVIREALEASSGRHLGVAMGLCYNPELVALGSVIHDLLTPDFVLIGESDAQAGAMVESLFRAICRNQSPIRRMSLVNAEIAKLAINAFLTTKISYANMLAGICERISGADVDVVTSAMGLDTRIGGKYLRGATAYGGPCFPRDNLALDALAQTIGARADLAEATDRMNHYQVERLLAYVQTYAVPGSRIGILGVSYKPDTSVIEASPGIGLAGKLNDSGYAVRVFDPMALDAARSILGMNAIADSMEECARDADVLVILTPWQIFSTLDPRWLYRAGQRVVIIDCWRVLPKARFESVSEIRYLGAGDRR